MSKPSMRFIGLLAGVWAASAWAQSVDAGQPSLPQLLHALLKDRVAEQAALTRLGQEAKGLEARLSRLQRAPAMAGTLEREVTQNLALKVAAGFPLTATQLERQVIDYEAFKVETFVKTGVFPKRYFGYVDEAWDTGPYERRLKVAAKAAAGACNRWLEAEGAALRVTPQELIVTFLAEGGAILLRERQADLEHVHPIQGIGLDDIAKGFEQLEPLVREVDQAVGTHLVSVVGVVDGRRVLTRYFTFEEALAGTAVMWVWEKRLAEGKLRAAGRKSLTQRALPEQFVIASLVYNSGILFDEGTVAGLRDLDDGAALFALSEKSKAKRWPLPVEPPAASLTRLLSGGDYPAQPTSWSALYHVLQRYGAYVGLSRFSTAFDERGELR
jgi:hypothetical protein